jgi:Ni,Fe-hydrogenase III large subunit/Ni,Fe-hydrogenase III component G
MSPQDRTEKVVLRPDPLIASLKEKFGDQISIDSDRLPLLLLTANSSLIRSIAEHVFLQLNGRHITCVAIDRGNESRPPALRYFFSFDKEKLLLCISSDLDPANPAAVDSLTPVIPGANWAEREMKDLHGISASGHPDLRRLILADDWPEGVYPLRSEFRFDHKPAPASGAAPNLKTPPASTTLLPLGSFYGQKETTAYFNLFVYGERVVDVDYRGFYNHRGLEKMAGSSLSYHLIPFIAERICACCGFSHSTCYCQAIESAARLEVPLRARFIRSALLEIERLYSHSLWLASICSMEGFKHLFLKCCALQGSILTLCQFLTGNRIIFGMNVIGGVSRDIPTAPQSRLSSLLGAVEKDLDILMDGMPGELSLFSHMKMISTLPRHDAQRFCVTGPTARASGIAVDARVDHPYAAYDRLPVEPVCRGEGDNLARVSVRIDEMKQSLALVREIISRMPEGAIRVKTVEIPPDIDCVSAVESPRGETVHYILTGRNGRPLRWKIKSATFSNLQAIPVMLRGTNIADARMSISSIDPCFSCVEH